MDLGSLFGKKFEKQKLVSKPEKNPEEVSMFERYPFENSFKQFLTFSKTLEADHDIVAGKAREYVSFPELVRAYGLSFGDAGLVKTALSHRVRNLNPEDFPDDLIVLPAEKLGDPKYYVNRLNTDLMKRLFLPDMGAEVRHMTGDIRAREEDLRIADDIELANSAKPYAKQQKQLPEDEEFHSEDEYFDNRDH